MKRFNVNGAKLYYDDIETAKKNWSDIENIYEIPNEEHLKYINEILEKSKVLAEIKGERNKQIWLETYTPCGKCEIKLLKDMNDNTYYDYLLYRLHKNGALISPTLWTVSNPENFVKELLTDDIEYTMLCRANKVSKPKELNGVKSIGSIPHIVNLRGSVKATAQIFILNNDVYIKFNDYFSPAYCKEEDIGTSLSYRANKYLDKRISQKFVYDDNWGEIILRRRAWIKISNVIPLMYQLDYVQLAKVLQMQQWKYHKFTDDCGAEEWQRTFESVVKCIKNYLKIN